MEKLDFKLLAVKKEIESVLSSLDSDIFDYKEAGYIPLGKAVRSRFSFMAGAAFGVEERRSASLAVCAEIVHNASLLHDDCVDEAVLRRGKPTLNSLMGVNKAILLGDLSMALAFQKAETLSCEISSQLAAAVKKMAEGALIEENCKWKIIDEAMYRKIVSGKTSALFRWIAVSSAFFSKERIFEKAARIAEDFGLAFQIIDDVIDLENCSQSGKDCFKDLLEGKFTMPAILAFQDKKFSASHMPDLQEFFSQPVKDIALAMRLASRIKEAGYTAAARKKAESLIEGLSEDIFSLPDRKAASDFYAFLSELCRRQR